MRPANTRCKTGVRGPRETRSWYPVRCGLRATQERGPGDLPCTDSLKSREYSECHQAQRGADGARRDWEGRVRARRQQCSGLQVWALGAGRGGATWGGAKPEGLGHGGQSQSGRSPSPGALRRERQSDVRGERSGSSHRRRLSSVRNGGERPAPRETRILPSPGCPHCP
jgi:hypothetical protein